MYVHMVGRDEESRGGGRGVYNPCARHIERTQGLY